MTVGGPHPKAEALWGELSGYHQRHLIEDAQWIRIVPIGQQCGLHPENTRNIVRYWSNEGLLVYPGDDANRVMLTDKGRRRLDDV